MKILFCTNSIGTRGGIERVTIVKANALAEMTDESGRLINQVAIAYSDKFRFPETIHPLSSLVKTYDTEADIWHDHYDNFWDRHFEPKRKLRKYHKRLQAFVDEFRPDVVIGVGQSEKYILPRLKTSWPMVRIREVHFNSNYRSFFYGTSFLSKIKIKVAYWLDFKYNCRFYDKVYLLTKEDKEENFANDSHFSYMWNPSSFRIDQESNRQSNREHIVLAVGRFDVAKDYPMLLKSWASIKNEVGDWKLRILGEGSEFHHIENLVNDLEISESVQLPGYTTNVGDEMRKASVFVLTSLYEGLPLVIVEAMSCRLPIVCFHTKYGPLDIVRNGIDGYIVEQREHKTFADQLLFLMKNGDQRELMSSNAEQRAREFDISIIIEKWMEEYSMLLTAKRRKWGQ